MNPIAVWKDVWGRLTGQGTDEDRDEEQRQLDMRVRIVERELKALLRARDGR